MFARSIALFFLLLAGLVFFYAWQVDSDYAKWMILPFIVAALVYILAPQINWWWYKQHPPQMEARERNMLERYMPFYRSLDDLGRQRFRNRVGLVKMATDWTPMAWPEENLPPEIQLILSAQAVALTFHRKAFLFEKFEKIVVYPQPFPSPEYPFMHASEMHEPDGCLIFSAHHLMTAFMQPAQWYNVGLHEYAKAFIVSNPEIEWPKIPETEWPLLEQAGGLTRAQIESAIGIAGIETLPVAIHHYFNFPEGLQKSAPELYHRLNQIFQT